MTLRPTFLGVCNEAVQRALAGDHSLDVPNRSRSTHSLTTTSCRCFQTRSASVHSRGHSVRKCASEHASGGVLNIRNPERTFKQYWAPPFSGACRRRPAARAPSDHSGSARRTTPPATRAAAAGPRWSPGSPASVLFPLRQKHRREHGACGEEVSVLHHLASIQVTPRICQQAFSVTELADSRLRVQQRCLLE